MSSNGQIGPQGANTNTTHDNEWNGFTGGAAQYAETYTESSGTNANTNSQFYVKSGSPYQPTQNYTNGTIGLNNYKTGIGEGIDVKSGLSGEGCLSLRMMNDEGNNIDAFRIASIDSTDVDIFEVLSSDTTYYEVYQNETQYRNKQLVYELIEKEQIYTTQTLQDFYTANQNSSYNDFISVNNAIAQADYTTAQNLNNSIITNNTIETYQKRVNELLLKYLAYQPKVDTSAIMNILLSREPIFNEIELADLQNIAESCLDKYGNAVTQARVLLNNVRLRSELSERSTHQRSNDSFSGIYLNFWFEGTKPMLSGYK